MEKITDINVADIAEVKEAIDKAKYCQIAADKVEMMLAHYADRTTFPYFVLERGNVENGEDPSLMYIALSKSDQEPRVSISQADSDAIILYMRDVYFAEMKNAILAKRNELLAKADELANPPA
jgi:hypothetical protein